MTVLHTFLLLLAAANPPAPAPDQPFTLQPGDFRWITITARKTPLELDCGFQVLKGTPTVHVELLPMGEFHLFTRGHDYNAMAVTPDGRRGEFKRVIDDRGQYAVVVVNERGAPPATVTMRVSTILNPGPGDIAETLSPERRLTVVAMSLAFFIVSIAWSGHRLIQAMRRHRRNV